METYLEAFDDFSPEKLEYGCRESTRTAKQFPKPGHIREAAEGYRPKGDRSEYSGPALEWDPELERERQARERSFKAAVARGEEKPWTPPEPVPHGERFKIAPSTKSLEEQKEELRKKGFLK